MKRFLTIALVASLGLFLAGTTAYGTGNELTSGYAAGATAGGVTKSRHNLGAFSKHIATDGTTEVCVFCHTPHHSNTSAAPLWNRGDATSLTPYGMTIGGSDITGTGAGAASLACLSCHDGTTQFDMLVNAPGKGSAGGDGDGIGATIQGWSFYEMGTVLGAMDSPTLGEEGRLNIGSTGVDAINTGAGLTDDHPIGVVYVGSGTSGARASLRNPGTFISTLNLTADLKQSSGTAGTKADAIQDAWDNIGTNLWAIGGFISSSASINDLLRPNLVGGTFNQVECASCHDPHFSNQSWDEYDGQLNHAQGDMMGDGLFLRRIGGNAGSSICRTCHNK